jgi:ATP-binding protein involved in chromosome partitioning
MNGAIIDSAPQEVAFLDVKRGIKILDKLGVKIIGLVDNISNFIGDNEKKIEFLEKVVLKKQLKN